MVAISFLKSLQPQLSWSALFVRFYLQFVIICVPFHPEFGREDKSVQKLVHLKTASRVAVLPEAAPLDIVPDQSLFVLHPEARVHEDETVLEDDDVDHVEGVAEIVSEEPHPHVLVILVITEEEPEHAPM